MIWLEISKLKNLGYIGSKSENFSLFSDLEKLEELELEDELVDFVYLDRNGSVTEVESVKRSSIKSSSKGIKKDDKNSDRELRRQMKVAKKAAKEA